MVVATAAWLFLYGIWVAVLVCQGYEELGVPFTAGQVAVASVVGASVGTLISRSVMQRRRSLGQRISAAVLSLLLAIVADLLAGIGVMFVTRVSGCAAGDILLGLAVPVAGLTGLIFGFSGGAFKKQIPVAALVILLALPSSGRADTNATATLRGRVVYADGQPAAAALVDASFAMPQRLTAPTLMEAYRTRTDEAGNYVLSHLDRGRDIPEVRVSLGEYADRVHGVSFTQQAELTLDFELEPQTRQQPQPDEAAKFAVHTPREPRHRMFSGRVVRQNGSAVDGALVTFDHPGTLHHFDTQTDAQGRYSLAAETSRSVLAVQARGCAPVFQLVLTRGDAQFDFVLKPGHWIEGRTLDREGKPVANVTVTAEASTLFGEKREPSWDWRYPLVNSRAVSGADGKFRLEDLPATGVLVSAGAGGYTPVQARAPEVDQPGQVLTLLPIGRIAGRVVRLADALPVADFTVHVVDQHELPAGRPYDGRVPDYRYGSKTFHSPDGLFSLPDQNTGQTVGVVVEADGYRREGARITISPTETADQNALTFRLSDQLVFTGVVTTPGGGAQSNLLVAVPDGRLKGGDFEFLHRPEADRTAVAARTDASGAFRLNGVRAHRGSLLIDNPGSWRSLVRDISLEELFQPEAWVCGKLTREGKPAVRELVELESDKPRDPVKALCLTSPSGEYCLYLDHLGDYQLRGSIVGMSGARQPVKLVPGENRYDLDVQPRGRSVLPRPAK